MCQCQNLPLKLICLTCFFIMAVDSVVLYQTVSQMNDIESKVAPDVFSGCYEPQIVMRIIFTCYAINAAALCFVLTLALCYLTEDRIEWIAMKLFTYTYIIFGPLMLIFCIMGFIFIRALLFQCTPLFISSSINFMDIFILFGCTAFSGIITLFYSMHQTVEIAQHALRDEKSIIYRLFVNYLGYRRRKMQRQQRLMSSDGNDQSQNQSQSRSYQSLEDQEQQQQQRSPESNSSSRRRRRNINHPISNSYLEQNAIEENQAKEDEQQNQRYKSSSLPSHSERKPELA